MYVIISKKGNYVCTTDWGDSIFFDKDIFYAIEFNYKKYAKEFIKKNNIINCKVILKPLEV